MTGRLYFGNDEKKGDRWRGALGRRLIALSCAYGLSEPQCRLCDVSKDCFFYGYFFVNKPHPYVIRPVLDKKEVYLKGEAFYLDFILIGEAAQQIEKFVYVITDLSVTSIDGGRGMFDIKNITALNVNDMGAWQLGEYKTLVIELETPIKLKDDANGLYFSEFTFYIFFKHLIKRLLNLTNLYGGFVSVNKDAIEKEKKALLEIANQIEMKSVTTWKDYERYSSRQKKHQKIGGHQGTLYLKGDLVRLYPFLKLGELVGVGQNTTSGFGRYKISGSPE
ncbi:MAG: CRISPR system precrRNA processing endoribonuclease RAMP protein Cas6 [Candidatus Magnetoovum sp. WYHC-5]|nr:CRISPR system precrRNA processing endoribonuclease RAMP protein Cas6 [Candidatus Magnetoovum sp. WYHC-5]